jgi:3-oxoadipate enol-lactonase
MTDARAGGVDVHHRFDGRSDGPLVVLINSLGTSLGMWDPQLPALATRHRVLRYDQRGHGRSPVPPGPYSLEDLGNDVLGLLDRVELERVSVCGISLGGLVGLWLAARTPERIAHAVLCATVPSFGTEEMWIERAATVRREGMDAVVEGTLDRWFSPEFRTQRPDEVSRIEAMLHATPREGYAACCEAIAGRDLTPELPSIATPILVVCGSDDPTSPPDACRRMQAALPHARLEVIDGARHLVNVERPEQFNALLLDHLDAPRVES